MKKEYGIHYEGNLYYGNNNCPGQILRNAVNPKIGLHVFSHAWEKENKPLEKWIQ